MSVILEYSLTLYICPHCGCGFGLPYNYQRTKYCPNGHDIGSWRAASIHDDLHDLKARAVDSAELIAHLHRSISSLKGALKRKGRRS
jgi:hypothetical protein